MFKIGDFSKLIMVSVRMLRYYDEVGLFKPAEIDKFTGYRYYSATQIEKINLIVSLRDMGFSVSEINIAVNLESDEDFKRMLAKRKSEVIDTIDNERNKLKRISDAIINLTKERVNMNYNVQIKSVPSYQVLSLRSVIPSYAQEGMLWGRLGEYAGKNSIKANELGFSIYHDKSYKENNVDVEVFMGVEELRQSEGEFVFKETEALDKVASILVSGDYSNLSDAYAFLAKWIEENNYTICGSSRQYQIKGPWNERNPANYLSEIQMPIVK